MIEFLKRVIRKVWFERNKRYGIFKLYNSEFGKISLTKNFKVRKEDLSNVFFLFISNNNRVQFVKTYMEAKELSKFVDLSTWYSKRDLEEMKFLYIEINPFGFKRKDMENFINEIKETSLKYVPIVIHFSLDTNSELDRVIFTNGFELTTTRQWIYMWE